MNKDFIGRNSDSVARHCSRCGLPLTDAASREHGIGPLCRKKNNDIFSKQIPVNIAASSAIMLSLTKDNFHSDIADQFDKVKDTFLSKLKTLSNNNHDHGIIVLGEDFRKIVDWFDVALSYPIQHNTKMNIIKLIDSMGYKRLAGVLRGDVCMSPAKVYLEDGMIVLNAKRNKMGYFAMRKEVPGILLPTYNRPLYKAPKSSYKQFLNVVERYWPFNDSDGILEALNNVSDTLASVSVTNSVSDTTPVYNQPVAVLNHNTGLGFTVKLPWSSTNNDLFDMVRKFKAIESHGRKYNPNEYTWSFKNSYLKDIKDIIETKYKLLENNP